MASPDQGKSRTMAYSYSHLVNHLQPTFEPNPSEIYNLTTTTAAAAAATAAMDTIIGFPSMDSSCWHHHQEPQVFSCEGNERPSQGLSLSLSTSKYPSTIGLQSFELRPQEFLLPNASSSRDGYFGNLQDGYDQLGQFEIRGSKYLAPAQELLNEFCNLGTNQSGGSDIDMKMKTHKKSGGGGGGGGGGEWEDEINGSSSSRAIQSLCSLDILELQKRKSKLIHMLDEVDRRYKHYCDQMKAVVSSFEAVAGNGAATVYSALASKAMSRHFRCLRDGIVGQIRATKKAMVEKDGGSGGSCSSRGETPRLRMLDQALRQQRAFQQMSLMESHPWRPQRGLPERAVSVLRAWLFEHFLHPYPSDVDKHILARQTGLSRSQVSNWFINARVRLWKPMVEEMYVEETKAQDDLLIPSGSGSGANAEEGGSGLNQNPHQDHKPTHDQLVRIDSECLSSIINNPEKNDLKNSKNLMPEQPLNLHRQQQGFGRITDSYGAMELDFSSYNHHHGSGVSYGSEHEHQNYGSGSGGGVSLTLGLQQHGGSGVSLAFSQGSQSNFYYNKEQIEDCQPVQYSLLDGEAHNLPYRNLMGAQLLHDLAG